MREEIKNSPEIEQDGTPNRRKGYCQPNLDTQFGRIEGLLVPIDRNEDFKRSYLLLTNDTQAGWRKPSSRCTKVA